MSLSSLLQTALSNQDFTSMDPQTVPMATDIIVESVNNNPIALVIDALRFAIMSCNVDALQSLARKSCRMWLGEFDSLHPFNLAATLLDGAKSCCAVVLTLLSQYSLMYLRKHNLDEFGHTFMVTILRSHKSVSLVTVSFRQHHRSPR